MKILIDMNLSPRWAPVLSAFHIEATHWPAVGKPTATDSEILAYAEKGDWVILTDGTPEPAAASVVAAIGHLRGELERAAAALATYRTGDAQKLSGLAVVRRCSTRPAH